MRDSNEYISSRILWVHANGYLDIVLDPTDANGKKIIEYQVHSSRVAKVPHTSVFLGQATHFRRAQVEDGMKDLPGIAQSMQANQSCRAAFPSFPGKDPISSVTGTPHMSPAARSLFASHAVLHAQVRPGAQVYARWKGVTMLYDGSVAKGSRGSGSTVAVQFNDGDFDPAVPVGDVLILQP